MRFVYPEPPDVHVLRDLFRCRLVFGAPRAEMRMLGRLEHMSIPDADTELARKLDRLAATMLAELPDHGSTAARVRAVIATHTAGSDPDLEHVARKLKLSVRTLQRRLAGEGVTLSGLIDDTRHELALRYLADRSLSVEEVGFLLGYSSPRAFSRAFKRWTSQTPAAFRRMRS